MSTSVFTISYGGTNFNPITEIVVILKLKTQEEKLQKGNLVVQLSKEKQLQ